MHFRASDVVEVVSPKYTYPSESNESVSPKPEVLAPEVCRLNVCRWGEGLGRLLSMNSVVSRGTIES